MGPKLFFKYPGHNKFSIDNAIGSNNIKIKKIKKKRKKKDQNRNIILCSIIETLWPFATLFFSIDQTNHAFSSCGMQS